MAERYMSIESFAEHMDISRSTVKRWIQRNIITTRRLKTGSVRIPVSQVDEAFVPEVKAKPGTSQKFDINRLVAEVQSRGYNFTNRQEV